MQRACQHCFRVAMPPDRFCANCGRPLADGHELPLDRRMAAVMVADLCGYTEMLSSVDAELVASWVHAFLSAGDDAVGALRGYVIDHAGDAVVAAFGAPMAHGDDAARAVRAALRLHESIGRLRDPRGQPAQMHCGIAWGEVVASRTHAGAAARFGLVGEAVNRASRLASAAAPGETLLDPACRAAAGTAFDFGPPRRLQLKGFTEPVEAWPVTGAAQARFPRAMVGRAAELAQCLALLADARASCESRAILVTGGAGMGKTCLALELERRARAAGWNCIWIRFEEAPGHPLATLAALMTANADASAPSMEERLLRTLLVGPNDDPAAAAQMHELDQAARLRFLTSSLARLLRAAAAHRPLLLLAEDLHCCEPHLRPLMESLAHTVSCAPFVLAVTSRPSGFRPDWPRIDLSRLSEDEARTLASRHELDEPVVAQCLARAEGHPLYLEQLLALAAEGGRGGLPGTLQSTVQARVDRLTETQRQVLQAASILGPEFEHDELAALHEESGTALPQLQAADFLRVEGSVVRFCHALVHEAVHASLLRATRRALHDQAARIASPRSARRAAYHWDQAGSPEAAGAYLRAGRVALEECEARLAVQLLRRGMELEPAQEVRDALRIALAAALRDAGQPEAAWEEAASVARSTGERATRLGALLELAQAYRAGSRLADAMAALDEAQALAQETSIPGAIQAALHNLRGNLHFAAQECDACLQAHGQALAIAQRCGEPQPRVAALSGLGDASYAAARYRTASNYFQQARRVAGAESLWRHEVTATAMQALCDWMQGRVAEAATQARAALQRSRELGIVQAELVCEAMAQWIGALSGDHDNAAQEALAALEKARAAGAVRFQVILMHCAGLAQCEAGRTTLGVHSLTQALELSRRHDVVFSRPSLLGALALHAPDHSTRQACLREGLDLLGHVAPTQRILFARPGIDAALRLGQWDVADALARDLRACHAAESSGWLEMSARRAEALVRCLREPGAQARAELADVRADVARAGYRYALAFMDKTLSG